MNEISNLPEVIKVLNLNKAEAKTETKSDLQTNINMTEGAGAAKKITNQDLEQALNERHPSKAVLQLLAKSPVGLEKQLSGDVLEALGYADTGVRAFHMGAPISYVSSDGGHITVYDDMRMGHTDAGPRTTVYKTDRYEQTIIYDNDGNPVKGTIKIKDNVAGFTEKQYDFEVKDGKLTSVIE